MSNPMAAGARVAAAIGAMKWVLIGLAMIVAGVVILLALVDDTTDYDAATVALTVGGCVVWSSLVWVLFGWFEHTLSALITIARNTSPQPPAPYDVPPQAHEQHRA